ncbi:MAG: adenine phosphoribosyltransferase [Firmicutes bacterium]|nr:adenine phosphoribosyltransferase [Bacillota bacterium]
MDLSSLIRIIPDFPKVGISFKDITTLVKDGPGFREAIDRLAGACRDRQIDLVVGPEARGFIVGAPLAYRLGVGFVPVRKAGKLPAETLKSEYQLEYGHDSLEIHQDAIKAGNRVLVVDDLLATGGTIKASIDLVERLGGVVAAVAFLIELTDLKGRDNLRKYDVVSVIKYNI